MTAEQKSAAFAAQIHKSLGITPERQLKLRAQAVAITKEHLQYKPNEFALLEAINRLATGLHWTQNEAMFITYYAGRLFENMNGETAQLRGMTDTRVKG